MSQIRALQWLGRKHVEVSHYSRRRVIMGNSTLLISWRKRWNRNLLRFLGSRARQLDIEDLAQETYLRLLRARDLQDVRNPEAYLISVASHVLAEWKQRHNPLETASLNESLAADRTDLEAEVDVRISQRLIDEALANASPMMRAVLLLRLRDDRSCKDIAIDLGLSERQVKRQLAHGYDLLRRVFEGAPPP
jgi:RNA polymerase sigma factor (sigma-70 family)